MSIYSDRVEDISIKILKTAKATFKNVAKAMIVKVLFQFIFQSSIALIGDFILVLKKLTIFNSKLKNQDLLYFY